MYSYYINTDLDIVSPKNLEPLTAEIEDCVCVIQHNYDRDGDKMWRATFEALDSGEEGRLPQQDIESLISVIESLSDEARSCFKNCVSKVMDIGWQSADDRPVGSIHLQPETLSVLAKYGISLGVSIYPSSENDSCVE